MSKMKLKWLEGGNKLDLMSMFKFALETCEAIPTRNIDGRLERWDVWEDSSHSIKLFEQVRTFTNGRVTKKVTTDLQTGLSYTVDVTLVDGKSTKIVRTFS